MTQGSDIGKGSLPIDQLPLAAALVTLDGAALADLASVLRRHRD